jgi:beta-glucosidase
LVDPATEGFVTELLGRMSLEEKVGQIIQADIGYITPDDLRSYPLGALLAGGESQPAGGGDRAAAGAYADTDPVRYRCGPWQQCGIGRHDLPA